jgi:uroporphyrinogen decarboxylase
MSAAIINAGAEQTGGASPRPAATEPAGRERFLDACQLRAVDRPPVWLMRQAGRALPEYRALKQKRTFLELVQTPELAAEVTLQPIRRFGFDAAILFSDILVIAEALGQPYRFRERGGLEMAFTLNSRADVQRLETGAVAERLQYVARALPLIREGLGGRTALLGFAGSPWTLANFMLEGGGVREYTRARALIHSDPGLFELLMEKLTIAVTDFLRLQIEAGVDAVQIFDSLGGLLPASLFEAASSRWMRRIIASLDGRVPVIVFSKGTHDNWEELAATGARILGLDWTVSLARTRARLPERIGLQGNLDPMLLKTSPAIVAAETTRILRETRGWKGHIFNLGHGVPPDAGLENIQALVDTVRSFK